MIADQHTAIRIARHHETAHTVMRARDLKSIRHTRPHFGEALIGESRWQIEKALRVWYELRVRRIALLGARHGTGGQG